MVQSGEEEVRCSINSITRSDYLDTNENRNNNSDPIVNVIDNDGIHDDFDDDVPIIDLMHTDHDTIVQQIATACGKIGFFHVINHGISIDLIQDFRYQCQQYFTQFPNKHQYRRNEHNSRGYFDNEYTKQRLDWKYALDVGVPGSRNWDIQPDNDIRNHCLDGYNQLPTNDDDATELPNFRSTVVSYFEACANLSHRIATLMTEGMLLFLQNQATSTNNDGNDSNSYNKEQEQLGKDIVNDLY